MREFITRKQLAAWLGVKVPTVGRWDRNGKGIPGKGPIYRNRVTAIYQREDVEKFLEGIGVDPRGFLPPQANGAGPRPRAAESSGVLEPLTTSTPDVRGREENAPAIAAEERE